MKLELKHIAPYLPYGLKVKTTNEVSKDKIHTPKFIDAELEMIYLKEIPFKINQPLRECHLPYIKPILRPINSITKEEALEFGILLTNENEMNDKEIGIGSLTLGDMVIPTIYYQDTQDDDFSIMIQFGGVGIGGRDLIPFEAYNWLFENHFDVFNLIENGLAIDKTEI